MKFNYLFNKIYKVGHNYREKYFEIDSDLHGDPAFLKKFKLKDNRAIFLVFGIYGSWVEYTFNPEVEKDIYYEDDGVKILASIDYKNGSLSIEDEGVMNSLSSKDRDIIINTLKDIYNLEIFFVSHLNLMDSIEDFLKSILFSIECTKEKPDNYEEDFIEYMKVFY